MEAISLTHSPIVPRALRRLTAGPIAGLLLVLGLALVQIALGRVALAQGTLHDEFESPQVRWKVVASDVAHRIEAHATDENHPHGGAACEALRFTAGKGTYLYLAYDIGRAPVIEELQPQVWFRCHRSGAQLMVRVVLPRTLDERTGRPQTMLLRGDQYTETGSWQALRVDQLPLRVQRQSWALRREKGPQIDTAEAYVDQLVLNVYAGPGTTQFAIDDLTVPGCVFPEKSATAVARQVSFQENVPAAAKVEVTGSLLLVDDRPVFPRIIEYRGESLSFLKQLGFNAVHIAELPTPEFRDEAARQGIWIISPPPIAPDQAVGAGDIGPEWDRVLAWDLGEQLTARNLPVLQSWAERIRRADIRRGRPLVGGVETEIRTFSRHLEIMRLSRLPLGTSLELGDYGLWLRERPRLARPGGAVWTDIQTDLAPGAREQAALWGSEGPFQVEYEPLRLAVQTALSAGVRGLRFRSQSRLDDVNDPVTLERAMSLELINIELDLVEPWAAAGKLLTTLSGSDPEIRAAMLQTDRARLVLPLWAGKQAQLVPGQLAATEVSIVAPVPESYMAYEITPCELKVLRHNRVTGGTRVVLGEFGLATQVLMTQDPLVLGNLASRAPQRAGRAAQLHRELAVRKLQRVTALNAAVGQSTAQAVGWLAVARASLDRCDRWQKANNYPEAYLEAGRAMRPLRLLQRWHFEKAAARLPPVASPLAISSAFLREHLLLTEGLKTTRFAPNILPAGDCDELSRMLDAGWRQLHHPDASVRSEAEISPTSPHGGKASIHLRVLPTDLENPPVQVESAPVWINTPEIHVTAGQRFRIHGWIRVPEPIIGSVDGLMIFDSMSGESLAERVGRTNGWQEFTLYRAAPRSGLLSVRFALTGLGDAWLDDISIEPLLAPSPMDTPPAATPPMATAERPTTRPRDR